MNKKFTGPSDKSFGLTFAVIFLLIAGYMINIDDPKMSLPFISLAVILGIVSLSSPEVLHPFNRIWFQFGVVLGKIMNPLILIPLYLILFGPIAIVRRLLGKHQAFEGKSKQISLWRKASQNPWNADKIKKQF